MSSGNETCDLEFRVRDRAEGLRAFSLVYVIFVITFSLLQLVLWYPKRKNIILRKRRFGIIALLCAVVIAQLWVGPVVRFGGAVGPCELYLITYLLIPVFLVSPLLVRLVLWVNEVKANWFFASNLSKGSSGEDVQLTEEFHSLQFRASNRWGFMILLACYTAITAIVLTIILAADICNPTNCVAGFTSDPVTLYAYIGFLVFIVSMISFFFYKYRNVPDLVGIWRESLVATAVPPVFSLVFFGFAFIDLGGFNDIRPSVFEWGIMVDAGVFVYFMLLTTVPIVRAYRYSVVKEPDTTFDDFLNEERGAKYFEFYCATELSLENYLFYNDAKDWRESFDKKSLNEVFHEGRQIVAKYIAYGSRQEVNIGAAMRDDIIQSFESENVTKDTLLEAQNEAYNLMYTHSYPHFKRSSFYALYMGDANVADFEWVAQAGISRDVNLSQRLTF